MLNLPQYRCYKVVGAVEIMRLEELNMDGGMTLHPVNTDTKPFYITQEFIDRHKPQVGGYFVEYEDGYQSFSPANVFESGYDPISDDEDESAPEQEEPDKGEDPSS